MRILRMFSILFLLAVCCTPLATFLNENYAPLLSEENHTVRSQYRVYHISDSLTVFSFGLNKNDLLYKKNGQTFNANARFQYELIRDDKRYTSLVRDSVLVSDSSLPDGQAGVESEPSGSIPVSFALKIPPENYFLNFTITDKNRGTTTRDFIYFKKKSEGQAENYIFKNSRDEFLSERFSTKNDTVYVSFTPSDAGFLPKDSVLFLRIFSYNFRPSPPPYEIAPVRSFFSYNPDTVIHLPQNKNHQQYFVPDKKGIYFISTDTLPRGFGGTVLKFEENFPAPSAEKELMEPLIYLTTDKEYKELLYSTNPKKALDDFWEKRGGDRNRSRVLIREFYQRVETANRLFTSYKEGWKTDRGMIYIVLGPPDIVYKRTDSENWLYQKKYNLPSVTFTFMKKEIPFSDAHYELERVSVYENIWYIGVENWRSGIIGN